jgi:superfamily II DNA/RNA helicase
MSFANLGLNAPILKAIQESGYTEATPIQTRAIPELITGSDLMASSQTGSGKTAAFMLPILQRLSTPSAIKDSRGPRILILTPTRELALQITQAANKYSKHMQRLHVVSILGGMPYRLQNTLLSKPVDILVATPGRLIDHLQGGRIDFSRVEVLVLDEADRMLDMGFIDDVNRIAKATPAKRQTVLFSATLEGSIAKLAQNLLKAPKLIEISQKKARHDHIEQRLHYFDNHDHRDRLLDHVLLNTTVQQAIIFTTTKRDADSLADDLNARGFQAAALHGDMDQGARNRTLTRMRRGGFKILVATDVAARGIDIQGISHVINYDLPKTPEDYVHRIGRTGRAGASGTAVSFVMGRDATNVKRLERTIGHTIATHTVPGLEPTMIAEKKSRNARRQHSEQKNERSHKPYKTDEFKKARRPRASFESSGSSYDNRGNTKSYEAKPYETKSYEKKSYGNKSYGNKSFGDGEYKRRSRTAVESNGSSYNDRSGKKSYEAKPYETKSYEKKSYDNKSYGNKSFGDGEYKRRPRAEEKSGNVYAKNDYAKSDKGAGEYKTRRTITTTGRSDSSRKSRSDNSRTSYERDTSSNYRGKKAIRRAI